MSLLKRDEIKKAALKYFTEKGYEGASLSEIAQECGIKKSSIYSHFSGKDELFLEVLRDAKQTEIQIKQTYFAKVDRMEAKVFLYEYLLKIIQMFQEDTSLKFWLRMGFFPPHHLYEIVQKEVAEVDKMQEDLLEHAFENWVGKGEVIIENSQTLTIAFIGIVINILVELVYYSTEKRMDEKLEAYWKIFWNGIKPKGI